MHRRPFSSRPKRRTTVELSSPARSRQVRAPRACHRVLRLVEQRPTTPRQFIIDEFVNLSDKRRWIETPTGLRPPVRMVDVACGPDRGTGVALGSDSESSSESESESESEDGDDDTFEVEVNFRASAAPSSVCPPPPPPPITRNTPRMSMGTPAPPVVVEDGWPPMHDLMHTLANMQRRSK